MAQTRTTCPRCHQPITADLNQLFDATADPAAKEDLLSGQFNLAVCNTCGYQGTIPTPLVYHDNEKELLLTYFPPELGLPMNEQEKLIGPLINKVVNNLPNEKRKAYLFRPQTMLTLQGLIEKVLEADGITHEMIQAQQEKVKLLQQLLMLSTPEDQKTTIHTEDTKIDEAFFVIMSQLLQGAMAEQDQESAKKLAELQKLLLTESTVGKKIKEQSDDAHAAATTLQEASKNGLTREILLDLILAAPSEIQFQTYIRMARSGMDYQFFQTLSERIDAAQGDEKAKLEETRAKMLKMVDTLDEEMNKQVEATHQVIDALLKEPDITAATQQILPAVNDLFIEVIKEELKSARQKNDLEKLGKLQQIIDVLQKASTPPPEYALIEEIMGASTEEEMMKVFENHRSEISQQFVDLLGGLVQQAQGQQEAPEVADMLQKAYKTAVKFSMQNNLAK
jgi:hypothetical protein